MKFDRENVCKYLSSPDRCLDVVEYNQLLRNVSHLPTE